MGQTANLFSNASKGQQVSTILGIGGAVAQGVAGYGASAATKAAAEVQASVNRTNAIISQNQANDATSRGVEDVIRRRLATSQLKGKQRVGFAANGVVANEGTAAAILHDTDLLGAFDENAIIANAEREAMGYRTQAKNYLGNAEILKSRADAESPIASGASALLTSGFQVADNWYKYKQTTTGSKKKGS